MGLALRGTLIVALVGVPGFVLAGPELEYFFPAGGQRGQAVKISVGGKFPQWPVEVWASDAALSVTALDEQGELEIEVGDNANPGIVWLRLFDETGAAIPRPWMIGTLGEVNEEEPNNEPVAAQVLNCNDGDPLAFTINGRLQKNGDVDVYAVMARKGQTLVADLDAQILAAPVDAVLQVLRPEGFVAEHSDDQQQLDPRAAYMLPSDGRWMVRVFGFPETPTNRVQFSGADNFVYRLTVTTRPVVTSALPLAARRGKLNQFQLFGWNLSSELAEIAHTPQPGAQVVSLAADLAARTISVPVVENPLLIETEPCSPSQPTGIDLPICITGRIDQPGDRDAFQFEAVQGERLSLQIESRELGYPLDPVLELFDSSDKRLSRDDDGAGGRDAQLNHQVETDGPLQVVISDLAGSGGADYVYRLQIERAEPSFSLTAESHQVVVKAGEKVDLSIAVARSHGFDEPITVTANELPRGVLAESVTSVVGDDSSKKVTLSFTAAADATAASLPIRIVGQPDTGDRKTARFTVPGHPVGLEDLWLTVVPK